MSLTHKVAEWTEWLLYTMLNLNGNNASTPVDTAMRCITTHTKTSSKDYPAQRQNTDTKKEIEH